MLQNESNKAYIPDMPSYLTYLSHARHVLIYLYQLLVGR